MQLLKEYGPLTGALGIVFYGLLRLSYVFFYVPLRTTPEEVGRDYSRVLSESIAGAVELMLLGAIVVAVLTVLFDFFARIVLPRLLRRPNLPPIRLRDLPRLPPRRFAQRNLTIAAAVVLLGLPTLASLKSSRARQGEAVRNVYFFALPFLPVLGVQASPAHVTWKDGDMDKPFPLADRKCLMYLGEANGTSVFYDVQTADSLRLPSGDIVIQLPYTFFVDDSCRQVTSGGQGP